MILIDSVFLHARKSYDSDEVDRQSAPQYDGNFNLYWYNGATYGINPEKQMYAAIASGYQMESVYDGLGRCLKRTQNGAVTLYAYDGWKGIFEWDGAGNALAWNVYGTGADELLWRWQPGAGYLHYHYDSHGNVMFLLDQNGALAERYTYDAFGR